MNIKQKLTTILWLVGSLFIVSSASSAGVLKICNKWDYNISIASGVSKDSFVTTMGWWNVDPGQCSNVVVTDHDSQTVYYRAQANFNFVWNGEDKQEYQVKLCIDDKRFNKSNFPFGQCNGTNEKAAAFSPYCMVSGNLTINLATSSDNAREFGADQNNKVTWYRGQCKEDPLSGKIEHWHLNYAALAFGDSDNNAGWSSNEPDQITADYSAVQNCMNIGSSSCHVALRIKSGQCFSVYRSNNNNSSALAKTVGGVRDINEFKTQLERDCEQQFGGICREVGFRCIGF